MDDLATPRKRKADQDDQLSDNSSSEQVTVLTPPSPTSNAPRHPWLASGSDPSVWSSPSSPQVASPLSSEVSFSYPPKPTKRPRLQKIETSLRHPKRFGHSRKSAAFTCRSSPLRPGSDIEDIGVVPTAEPGPSTGSLLDLRPVPKLPDSGPSDPVPFIPIDTSSPHIPPLQPLINRQTLKELDLDTILRNPQLRAFHPG